MHLYGLEEYNCLEPWELKTQQCVHGFRVKNQVPEVQHSQNFAADVYVDFHDILSESVLLYEWIGNSQVYEFCMQVSI